MEYEYGLMTKADKYLVESIYNILQNGIKDENPRPKYEDGTPAHTYFVTHQMRQYDLSKGEFPICTLRPIAWKSAIKEMFWIFQKESNDLKVLNEMGVHFWDLWDVGDGTNGYRYGHTVHRYSFKTFVRKKNCNTVSNAYSDPVFGHDAVKNPSHYTGKKYEVISFIEDRGLGYCLGNVAKYICRAGKKYPGDSQKELQDLNKAKWYLERRLTEDNTVDVEDQKFKIDVNDFIEDQELNYNRGEIIRCISTWCADNVEVNLKISLALLDSEIHRMEDGAA